MRVFLSILILAFFHVNLVAVYAQNASQYDSAPLLKQARISFESHDLQKGESLLEQWVQEERLAFPSGYTFGFDAASVAAENLDGQAAIEVITKLKDHFKLPEDLPLRQGVEAALLNAYIKAKQWSDGVQLVDEIQGEPKTNFVLNITVLNFNRALASSGKTNEAMRVSKQFFGGGTDVTDQVMPAGYWMQQNAETALMLNQQSNSLQILDNIEKTSPDYYRTNQIEIIMLKVSALENLAKFSEVARQLSMANDINQKDHPQLPPADQQLLQSRLKAYQRAGWLDDNYKTNQAQAYKPSPGSRPDPIIEKHFVLIRIIMLIVFLLPLPFFIFAAFKKRNSK